MRPHSVSIATILLVSVTITGCVQRDGRNSDCKWPRESRPKTLDPTQRDDAGHLREDVEFAEELAVEYMDVHHGRAASQALNACRSELIGQIGKSHNIPPDDGWTITFVMVTLASLAFAVGGTTVGEAWSSLVEGIRVGNGHLSYRTDHLPWVHHHIEAFLLCLALFWGATASRYWMRQRHRSSVRL